VHRDLKAAAKRRPMDACHARTGEASDPGEGVGAIGQIGMKGRIVLPIDLGEIGACDEHPRIGAHQGD
jgi:hypothetical protein